MIHDELIEKAEKAISYAPGQWDTHSGMVRKPLVQTGTQDDITVTTSKYPIAECFHLGPEHPIDSNIAEMIASYIALANPNNIIKVCKALRLSNDALKKALSATMSNFDKKQYLLKAEKEITKLLDELDG